MNLELTGFKRKREIAMDQEQLPAYASFTHAVPMAMMGNRTLTDIGIEQIRERNRIHSKNTRERKRCILEEHLGRVKYLLEERENLKSMLTSTGYDMQKVTLSGVTFTDEQLEASCDELDEMKKELDENMEKILTMKEMGGDQYHRELAYLRKLRNRIHAKTTRIRRKQNLKDMQEILPSLESDVETLKSLLPPDLQALSTARDPKNCGDSSLKSHVGMYSQKAEVGHRNKSISKPTKSHLPPYWGDDKGQSLIVNPSYDYGYDYPSSNHYPSAESSGMPPSDLSMGYSNTSSSSANGYVDPAVLRSMSHMGGMMRYPMPYPMSMPHPGNPANFHHGYHGMGNYSSAPGYPAHPPMAYTSYPSCISGGHPYPPPSGAAGPPRDSAQYSSSSEARASAMPAQYYHSVSPNPPYGMPSGSDPQQNAPYGRQVPHNPHFR